MRLGSREAVANMSNSGGTLLRADDREPAWALSIPRDKFGQVIGKDGIMLKSLQSRHKVRLTVPRRNEITLLPTVMGSPGNVIACMEELNRVLGQSIEVVDREHFEGWAGNQLVPPQVVSPPANGAANTFPPLSRETSTGQRDLVLLAFYAEEFGPTKVRNEIIHCDPVETVRKDGSIGRVDPVSSLMQKERFMRWVATTAPSGDKAREDLDIGDRDIPYLVFIRLLVFHLREHHLRVNYWMEDHNIAEDERLVLYKKDLIPKRDFSPEAFEVHLREYSCSTAELFAALPDAPGLNESTKMNQFRNRVVYDETDGEKLSEKLQDAVMDSVNNSCHTIADCIAAAEQLLPASEHDRIERAQTAAVGIQNVFHIIHGLHNDRLKVRGNERNGQVTVKTIVTRMREILNRCPNLLNLPEAVVRYDRHKRLWMMREGQIALYRLETIPDFDLIFREMMEELRRRHGPRALGESPDTHPDAWYFHTDLPGEY